MRAPVAAPPERFNFAEHLLALNAGRGEKVAYVDDDTRLTYGDLALGVRRMAAGLDALGVRSGQRMLVAIEDCADWPVVFLGALWAGVVPVAVSTLLTADDYAFLLADSAASAVVVSGALAATMGAALARAEPAVQAIIVARPLAAVTPPAHVLAEVLRAAAPSSRAAPTRHDDVAFWLYSSGSTGRPKGTMHRHASPYWTAQLYGQAVLGMRESDVVFSASKLFFAYGLGNALTFPLSVGATAVLMAGRPTPDAIAARLCAHRPTILCGAPTGYAALLASPSLPVRDAVALRLCSSAGEALPAEIGRRIAAHFGVDVIDGLGSTEMLHVFLSNRPGDVGYGTSGRPVPGYEVEVRGDDGRPTVTGDIGDLYIKGPSAALGYWGDPERSAATFQNEWVKSGDKYSVDADGRYTYAGRSDDMIKVSGLYVSPFEVEGVLVRHPEVLEAAVVGVPDADGLIKTKAYVVVKAGCRGNAALGRELQAFVKQHLAPYKYPRAVEFVPELPKTATGKIQRFRLRALACGGGADQEG